MLMYWTFNLTEIDYNRVFFFGNEERRNMLLLMFSFSDCKSRLFSFYKAVYGYLFQHNSWWYILVFVFLLFLKIVLFSAAKSENITRPPNPLLYEILVFIIFQVYIVDKTCLEKWIPLKTQILVQKTLSNLIFVLRVWPCFFLSRSTMSLRNNNTIIYLNYDLRIVRFQLTLFYCTI